MIPLRSLPMLASALVAVVVVAWMSTHSPGSSKLFADPPPATLAQAR
jgi:hypothetical protein